MITNKTLGLNGVYMDESGCLVKYKDKLRETDEDKELVLNQITFDK